MEKYTKEKLEEVANHCSSVSEILRYLGTSNHGSTHNLISKKLKKFGINTSHFLGYGHGKGKSSNKKLSWKEILVYGISRQGFKLKRALIEFGRKYICEVCGVAPIWCGKELKLQVDHINANKIDNTPENLRFICPNCHSQTDNFCFKGRTHKNALERSGE